MTSPKEESDLLITIRQNRVDVHLVLCPWYVLETEVDNELPTVLNLNEAGFRSFVPLGKGTERFGRHRGKRSIVRALTPGMCFAAGDIHEIMNVDGVTGLMGKEAKPYTLGYQDLLALLAAHGSDIKSGLNLIIDVNFKGEANWASSLFNISVNHSTKLVDDLFNLASVAIPEKEEADEEE